jgi:plastocyanin
MERHPLRLLYTILIPAMLSCLSFAAIAASIQLPDAAAAKIREAFVTIEVNTEGDSLTPDVFSPNEIIIKKKTTVTWTNNDPVLRHTVTEGISPAYEEPPEGYVPAFNSGVIQPSGTFSYTFEKKGEYYYYCSIHPYVTGEVVVGKEN